MRAEASRAEARTSVLAKGQNLEIDRIHSGQFESKQGAPRRSKGPAGEQINYENLIPTQPDEDVVAFALDQGAFREHYLVYQSAQDMAEVTCSACGEQFYAGKVKAGGCSRGYASAPFGWYNDFTGKSVISGQTTVCPECLGKVKTVHVGNMRLYNGELVDDAYVTVLSRLPVGRPQDARKAPRSCNGDITGRIRKTKRALHRAGFTWPSCVDAGDQDGHHLVFECQIVEGVEVDGKV